MVAWIPSPASPSWPQNSSFTAEVVSQDSRGLPDVLNSLALPPGPALISTRWNPKIDSLKESTGSLDSPSISHTKRCFCSDAGAGSLRPRLPTCSRTSLSFECVLCPLFLFIVLCFYLFVKCPGATGKALWTKTHDYYCYRCQSSGPRGPHQHHDCDWQSVQM